MSNIKIFESKKVRSEWDADKEDWWFSVVDVCGALSNSNNPRRYWSDLKIKLIQEGSELYGKIVQLKMKSSERLQIRRVKNLNKKLVKMQYHL